MKFPIALVILVGVWSLLGFINAILLACSHTSLYYAKFLHKNGISIGFLQIKWYTVKLNRLFIRIANWKPLFWKNWFNIGVAISLIGQVIATCLLITTLVGYFIFSKPASEQVLVPIVSFSSRLFSKYNQDPSIGLYFEVTRR
jgi:hypothetical protein